MAQNDYTLDAGAFLALSVLFRPMTLGQHDAVVVLSFVGGGAPETTITISGPTLG